METSEVVNAEGVASVQLLASAHDSLVGRVVALEGQAKGLIKQVEGLREQLRSLEKNTQRDMETTRNLVDAASKLAIEAQKAALAAQANNVKALFVEQHIAQIESRLEAYNANHKKLGYSGLI